MAATSRVDRLPGPKKQTHRTKGSRTATHLDNLSLISGSPPSPTSPLLKTPFSDPWTAYPPSLDPLHPHSIPKAQQQAHWNPHLEILAPKPVRVFSMDFPASLENSWRTEDIKGKEKEVIWDAQASLGQYPPPSGQEPKGYTLSLGPTSGSSVRPGARALDKSLERWLGRNGPLPTAVWASIMDTSAGRDKILKSIQYSLKTYLYVLSLIARVRPLSRWFVSNTKRMKIATASLSLTRKCLLLLNPLHPLTHLLSPEPTSATTLIRHIIDLAGAIADDMYCFSLLGLVDRRRGRFAERWANRFWLLNTLLGLWKLHTRTIPRLTAQLPPDRPSRSISDLDSAVAIPDGAQKELSNARWTNHKLLADLTFVSYAVFHLSWAKEPVQCLTGLISGLISTGLLYDRHWDASIGKG